MTTRFTYDQLERLFLKDHPEVLSERHARYMHANDDDDELVLVLDTPAQRLFLLWGLAKGYHPQPHKARKMLEGLQEIQHNGGAIPKESQIFVRK